MTFEDSTKVLKGREIILKWAISSYYYHTVHIYHFI